jgi:hypothetical protein
MKRTQIYLEENLYQDLNIGSQLLGISVSEYIRRLLSKEIYLRKITDFPLLKRVSLINIVKGSVSLGKKDLAKNFDFYLEKSLK